jgi:hypothetical protein
MLISLRSVRKWFVSHNFAREISFVQSVPSVCHTNPGMHSLPVVLSAGNSSTKIEVSGTSPFSVVPENAWRYISSHNNQLRYLLFVALGQSGLYLFQAVILEKVLSIPTVISPLKPRGIFLYRLFCTAKYFK